MNFVCPHCKINYSEFRTGLQYEDVFDMLWVSSENPEEWVYKRKGSVLRLFHAIKLGMWKEHVEHCAEIDLEIDDTPCEY
jgi:hypothetical protein